MIMQVSLESIGLAVRKAMQEASLDEGVISNVLEKFHVWGPHGGLFPKLGTHHCS